MEKEQTVSTNIASLRKEAGLTQAELGEALSYTDKAVSKWERGDSLPDAGTLFRISVLFHVDMNYLFQEHPLSPIRPEQERKLRKRETLIRVLYIATNAFILLALVGILLSSIAEIYGIAEPLRKYLFILPAIPAILLAINNVFGRRGKTNTVLLSLTVWFMAYASFVFWGSQLTILFAISAVIQVAIIFFPFAASPFERKGRGHK